jgi:hypothetical protein
LAELLNLPDSSNSLPPASATATRAWLMRALKQFFDWCDERRLQAEAAPDWVARLTGGWPGKLADIRRVLSTAV